MQLKGSIDIIKQNYLLIIEDPDIIPEDKKKIRELLKKPWIS
jgi:hypothetical protein